MSASAPAPAPLRGGDAGRPRRVDQPALLVRPLRRHVSTPRRRPSRLHLPLRPVPGRRWGAGVHRRAERARVGGAVRRRAGSAGLGTGAPLRPQLEPRRELRRAARDARGGVGPPDGRAGHRVGPRSRHGRDTGGRPAHRRHPCRVRPQGDRLHQGPVMTSSAMNALPGEPETTTRTELITLEPAEALAGMLDIDAPSAGDELPALWHWIYLLERRRQSDLGPDGHPRHGIPAPPGPGRLRMFAGGRVSMHTPLRFRQPATRTTRVIRTAEKEGKSGLLTFVTVRSDIEQGGRCLLYT